MPPAPYRVWLSEVMLQQTTVAAVIPYFEAFTRRWPTVEALAAANEADVMSAWAGLGYYSRARNLVACARTVAKEHDGLFPSDEENLRELPGIGAYTAAAIAAIAFDCRAVVVDGNVERVVARLFAVETPIPSARPQLRTLTDGITPNDRVGDFAQAMMDLGATICTPRSPKCLLCPLSEMCSAMKTGDPARFPLRTRKQEKPSRRGLVWWIERDGQVFLVTRPPSGLLGGMRALPSAGWDGTPGLSLSGGRPVGMIRHVFTHFSLDLEVRIGADDFTPKSVGGGEWWPIAQLGNAGLPGLFAKAAQMASSERDPDRSAD